MSLWTHAICDACYWTQQPDRVPHRIRASPESDDFYRDTCCWCGSLTRGIYLRADPSLTPCLGDSPTHRLHDDS